MLKNEHSIDLRWKILYGIGPVLNDVDVSPILSSIWIFSAIFALATCFPDKIFGVTVQEITPRDLFFRPTNSQMIAMPTSSSASLTTVSSSSRHTKEQDISYCYIRSSMTMVDYVAMAVAFMLPLLIGPCIVAVFQVKWSSELYDTKLCMCQRLGEVMSSIKQYDVLSFVEGPKLHWKWYTWHDVPFVQLSKKCIFG